MERERDGDVKNCDADECCFGCRGVGEFDRYAVYRCLQPLNAICGPRFHIPVANDESRNTDLDDASSSQRVRGLERQPEMLARTSPTCWSAISCVHRPPLPRPIESFETPHRCMLSSGKTERFFHGVIPKFVHANVVPAFKLQRRRRRGRHSLSSIENYPSRVSRGVPALECSIASEPDARLGLRDTFQRLLV